MSLAPHSADTWTLFRRVVTVSSVQGIIVLKNYKFLFFGFVFVAISGRRVLPPLFSVSLAPFPADTWSLFRLPHPVATVSSGQGIIA